jgi:lysosomal-associated transmembrane protein
VTQLICLAVLTFAILNPHVLVQKLEHRIGDAGQDIKHGGRLIPLDSYRGPSTDVVKKDAKAMKSDRDDTPLEQLEDLPTPLPLRESEGVAGSGTDAAGSDAARNVDGSYRDHRRFRQAQDGFFYTKADMLLFTRKRLQSGDVHLALALVFGLVFITALLVYGAVMGRPVYLLPFFCFQVFDFILACLTAIGHYTYLPNMRDIIASSPGLPYRDDLLRLNSQWIGLLVLVVYMMALFVKAYFIGVVWACYQYLQARGAMLIAYPQNDAEQLLLPPDYDAATKMAPAEFVPPPMYGQTPPGYSSA